MLTREQILDGTLPPGMGRLNRIARRIRAGETIDAADLAFVAKAFQEIVDGGDAKKALGVSGKKHQGRKPMTHSEAGRWLNAVMRIEELRRDADLTLAAALDRVATERHVGRDALEKHHKKRRSDALAMLAFKDDARRAQKLAKRIEEESRSVECTAQAIARPASSARRVKK